MRPKAKWDLGRVFLPYGRVLKTRPQNLFFVVSINMITCIAQYYVKLQNHTIL